MTDGREQSTEEIVVKTGSRKRFVLAVETPEGKAHVTFKRVKNNEYMKLMIDAEKLPRSWERLHAEQMFVFSKAEKVENLFDDGEEVTLDMLHAGEMGSDLTDVITQGFWAVFWAEKRRIAAAEANEKNEQEKGEDLPQG